MEIVIDSKKRRGLRGLKPFYKVDSLAMYIASKKEMNRPLTLSEGLKFATMGFNDLLGQLGNGMGIGNIHHMDA